VDNLVRFNFKGRVYPVNPSGGSIKGLKVYTSLEDIKDDVELAVVAIPAKAVPSIIQECIRKGVKSAIVISAGFKEAGSEGATLEKELKEIARERKVRILGPNCLGIINTDINLNVTFAKGMLPEGNISFFSQSGALGIAVLDWAVGNRIGFSKFISLGNKVDLNETDFIQYLMDDPKTEVILGYIEDVINGKRFLKVAKECTSKKPIILIKSGGTQAGARAASSHTGALAGSEEAFNAAFKQTGIIRASGVEELFDVAKVFSTKKIPASDRVIIITNAGGPGILAADQAERLGLKLPFLDKSAINRLTKKLPPNASPYNPVDVIGDATSERYSAVLEEVISSKNFDGIIIILTPQAMTDVDGVAEVVISASKKTAKPMVTSFMGAESVERAVEHLKKANIPNYPYPEDAITSYGKLVVFSQWWKRKEKPVERFSIVKDAVRELINKTIFEKRFALGEEEARDCLGAYGFVFPRRVFVTDKRAAADESAKMGFPVVMKVSSPDVLHKTDVGGIRIGINSSKEAGEAFIEITTGVKRRIPKALVRGVNIYEMIRGGKEVIIGVTHDRTFGHMMMFGLGGIYVEVLRDVSFRIIPVTETDVREMVQEIRTYSLLKGTRGEKAVDIDAIVDGMLRLNQMILDFPEIHEVDINPLIVKTKGAIALDARIIIHGG
jgi:acetyltransferase